MSINPSIYTEALEIVVPSGLEGVVLTGVFTIAGAGLGWWSAVCINKRSKEDKEVECAQYVQGLLAGYFALVLNNLGMVNFYCKMLFEDEQNIAEGVEPEIKEISVTHFQLQECTPLLKKCRCFFVTCLSLFSE